MPHLHAAIWFMGEAQPADGSEPERVRKPVGGSGPNGSVVEGKDIPYPAQLVALWQTIAKEGEPARISQDVKTITTEDAGHWIQYLAKHAVRGVSNYQRSAENIPLAWKGKTGRVWRKGGDWPTKNRVEVHGLNKAQEYQYRRLFCRYLASLPSSMRIKAKDKKAVRNYWKSWRKCSDIGRSHLRAPSSFIRIETQVRIIKLINSSAYFTDEKTGEIFNSVDDMPIDRSPKWIPPEIHLEPATMADICE